MRSTIFFIFSAVVLLFSCKDKHGIHDKKTDWVSKVTNKDNGPERQKEYSGDFDEIEVSQAIEAEVIKSETERVVISAPENIIDEVLVDNNGGKLHIHYKAGIRIMNSSKVSARIYAKDFTKLKANSAAKIKVKDQFTQEKTGVDASSAASISGNLEANELDINVSSSSSFEGKVWAVDLDIEASSAASVTLSGKSKNGDLSASSGSSISAKEVMVDNIKADASSGSDLSISVTSKAEAKASSGGSVNIYKKGNVIAINKEESSGGSINVQ